MCHAAEVCCVACTVMVEAMHPSSIAARSPDMSLEHAAQLHEHMHGVQ